MTTATAAIDDAKRRAEISSAIFDDRLRYFVRTWAPQEYGQDRDDFQMDLTRLMVDAMRHKSDCLSFGIATYADMQFSELALRPLAVIMKER